MRIVSNLIRSLSNYSKMRSKILLAFDFDHTVMEDNTDVRVQDLAPDGIPPEIKARYSKQGWTEYMGAIFAHLHEHGVKKEDIVSIMNKMPYVSGMEHMLRNLNLDLFEVIIISDSNSFFIECILENADLAGCISKIYTNPAQFNTDGCLTIEYYHTQDWCTLSTVNLCKGHILEEHIAEAAKNGVQYPTVAYIGDGGNDLCPSLRLRANDVCFARAGFTLPKKIASLPPGQMAAQVVQWSDGHDLEKEFKLLGLNSS